MKTNIKIIGTVFSLLAFQCCVIEAATNAAAFTPSNPPGMQPLANHNSPAWRAARMFQHGANLGNYLETPPGQNWGITVSADEFAAMKREGFDHVRVPVGWHHYAGAAPDFTLAPEIFSRVDFVVTNALANQLAVMINIHHFDELDKDPAKATAEFLAIWRQIAAHYKDFPDQLVFELDNEPHGKATTALMNPIHARAIAEIRQSNPHRTIVVEPGGWGGIGELKNLILPPDDNVMVSVHCYDPFYFTHQGASWAGPDTKATGIQFPGPPAKPLVPDASLDLKPWVVDWIKKYNTLPADKNPSSPLAFTDKLKFVRAWSDYYGYPVHLGEFGSYTKADPTSRANFYAAFRRAAEAQKIGWCIWDWSAGFRYWDKSNQRPLPGMHAALFGGLN
ncbi:MAG: glycoside hydrolase family 5 protein [Verrucomicrobiales bacterium]|nr:glycoside hydrolase family 5 protein [Verrucomicrobiales bacterium]